MGARSRNHHGKILVGTTSWTEKTLLTKGKFYPPTANTPELRLRYYAGVFPLVEVDSSYYGLPSRRNAALWVERTPSSFVFDIKAYRLFTQHKTPVASLPADLRESFGTPKADVYYHMVPTEVRMELWRRFRAALEPLVAADRLGVVLFQFAPWVVFGNEGMRHIAHCAEMLADLPIAVEMRNISWLGEQHRAHTLGFLRQHGLVHVVVDEPQSTSFSVPSVWEVTTSGTAVVRLHGRNRVTWQRKRLASAAERFAYKYSEDELKEFVTPVRALARQAKCVHVLFNNCYADWAQDNARSFSAFLETRLVSGPPKRTAAAPRANSRQGRHLRRGLEG